MLYFDTKFPKHVQMRNSLKKEIFNSDKINHKKKKKNASSSLSNTIRTNQSWMNLYCCSASEMLNSAMDLFETIFIGPSQSNLAYFVWMWLKLNYTLLSSCWLHCRIKNTHSMLFWEYQQGFITCLLSAIVNHWNSDILSSLICGSLSWNLWPQLCCLLNRVFLDLK